MNTSRWTKWSVQATILIHGHPWQRTNVFSRHMTPLERGFCKPVAWWTLTAAYMPDTALIFQWLVSHTSSTRGLLFPLLGQIHGNWDGDPLPFMMPSISVRHAMMFFVRDWMDYQSMLIEISVSSRVYWKNEKDRARCSLFKEPLGWTSPGVGVWDSNFNDLGHPGSSWAVTRVAVSVVWG